MFYDKEINIMSYTEGYKDKYGIWHDDKMESIKTIDCDVQPITRELAKRDFGYEEDVSHRVFCDIEDIEAGTIIKYNNKYYEVLKMMVWDYIDMIVGDYDV